MIWANFGVENFKGLTVCGYKIWHVPFIRLIALTPCHVRAAFVC